MSKVSLNAGLMLLSLFVMSCAQENLQEPTDPNQTTFPTATPSPSTGSGYGSGYSPYVPGGTTGGGGGTYIDPGTTTDPETACPADMTWVAGDPIMNQGGFCMDKAINGGYGYGANLYWADQICGAGGGAANQGKHLCFTSELHTACGNGKLTPNTLFGYWIKATPAPVPNYADSSSDKTGDYMTGSPCSAVSNYVTNHANSDVRLFYCCK